MLLFGLVGHLRHVVFPNSSEIGLNESNEGSNLSNVKLVKLFHLGFSTLVFGCWKKLGSSCHPHEPVQNRRGWNSVDSRPCSLRPPWQRALHVWGPWMAMLRWVEYHFPLMVNVDQWWVISLYYILIGWVVSHPFLTI